MHSRIVQLEGDNSFKPCPVRVRVPVRLHKSRYSIPVWRLVCKTNLIWVQFPSCSRFVWKVSIIGNAAVLKTAVREQRLQVRVLHLPRNNNGEQVDIGLLRHPAKMFHANSVVKVRFLCSPPIGPLGLQIFMRGVGNDGGVTTDCKSVT